MPRIMLNRFENIKLRTLIKVFPFFALFHELEEWNILAWHRIYNSNVPPEITDSNLHNIFILISVVFFIWIYLSLIPKNIKITTYILIPLFVGSLLNGVEHVIWTIDFGIYAPGPIFGFFLETPLIFYIFFRMIKDHLITKWCLFLFGIIVFIGSLKLIVLENKLDPIIVSLMKFSKTLSELIRQ
jgi:hypothetical protein